LTNLTPVAGLSQPTPSTVSPCVLTAADYYRLRDMLFTEFPEALDELVVRCNETGVGTVDAEGNRILTEDDFWRSVGDKPLFTNMSVKAGRSSEKAWRVGLFPDWHDMGSDRWQLVYRKSGSARATDNYTVVGPDAQTFVGKRGRFTTLADGTRFRRPRTAMFRLYAMRGLARWLVEQNQQVLPVEDAAESRGGSTGLQAPKLASLSLNLGKHSPIEKVAETCRELAEAFGLGWGVTTVLHGLMDCGYWVVKPDVHLVRTVAKLGCLKDPTLALADSDKFLKKEACLFEVVDVARELARRITPLPESGGKAIREVDVVLMRANYHGLVEKFKAPSPRKAA
jgi:hypothetical protein